MFESQHKDDKQTKRHQSSLESLQGTVSMGRALQQHSERREIVLILTNPQENSSVVLKTNVLETIFYQAKP